MSYLDDMYYKLEEAVERGELTLKEAQEEWWHVKELEKWGHFDDNERI